MAEPHRKAALIEPGGGAHLAWLGARVRYLAVGEQAARRYSVSVDRITTGAGMSLRRTREHAGFYVLSGTLAALVGNRPLTVPEGGFLNVAPGNAYRLDGAGEHPAEVLSITAPAGFDEFRFRAGFPLAGPKEPTPASTAADRITAAALAPAYGIDLDPPASAFSADPRFRLTLPGEGKAIAAAGGDYRPLAVAGDTDGRYGLWHVNVPPGQGIEPRTLATEDAAFYVLSGGMTLQVDGTSKRFQAGGFAHVPGNVRHRFANETAEPAETLLLVGPASWEPTQGAADRA